MQQSHTSQVGEGTKPTWGPRGRAQLLEAREPRGCPARSGWSMPRAGLLRPGATCRCRRRGTAPGLPASRTRTLVTLPRKLWGSCKPTRHVGRALGQQRCFLKTQQFRRQERRPHAESPSHSEPTHTAEITIRAAPSAPSGLRPVWGQEPVSPTSCPLALGRCEVPSQPQAAGPVSPANTYRSGGQHRGLGPVLTTHNGVLVPPAERPSRGGQGQAGGRGQPAGHRKSRGSKTDAGPHG